MRGSGSCTLAVVAVTCPATRGSRRCAWQCMLQALASPDDILSCSLPTGTDVDKNLAELVDVLPLQTQSFDQKFENMNKALQISCQKGLPVRVVRSHKVCHPARS